MSPKRFLSRCGAFASFCALITISLSTPLHAGPGMVESEFTGPIGLKELIAIALKNDPKLVELRGEITIGQAKKRAEKDWRDPELRFARSWENDRELDQPYQERIVERSSDRTNDSRKDNGGKERESANRSITEETVRNITPGATSDSVSETTTRTETTSGTERKANGQNENFSTTETLQRTTERQEFHGQDPLARDDDYSFRLRIFPPNPKEKKARLLRAQAEIDLTRAELRTEEREVIAGVRSRYEEIQFLKALVGVAQQKAGTHAGFTKDMKALEGELTTPDEVALASLNGIGASFDIDAAQNAYDNAVGTLAAKLGIVETSRITIYESLARPSIPLESKDLAFFIELAFANRGELQEVISEGHISEAELKIAKSKYMPWFNYVQVDYGINNSGGQQTSDNYGIQFGMSLPFFSWLGHEKAIYEAAIEARYAKMGAIKRTITGQVANAYRAVKKSAALKSRSESNYQSAIAIITRAEAAPAEGKDGAKLRYKAAEEKVKVSEARLRAQREYARALLLFEEAIGSDINEIYSSSVAAAAPFSNQNKKAILKSVSKKNDKEAALVLAKAIEKKAVPKKTSIPAKTEPQKKEAKKGLFNNIFKKSADRDKSSSSKRRFGKKR